MSNYSIEKREQWIQKLAKYPASKRNSVAVDYLMVLQKDNAALVAALRDCMEELTFARDNKNSVQSFNKTIAHAAAALKQAEGDRS